MHGSGSGVRAILSSTSGLVATTSLPSRRTRRGPHLGLMDVCRDHSPDEDWTMSHEQYRPFVLFHRTRAAALAELDDHGPEKAIAAINEGLDRIKEVSKNTMPRKRLMKMKWFFNLSSSANRSGTIIPWGKLFRNNLLMRSLASNTN